MTTLPDFSDTALLCWPVEFYGHRHQKDYHVTSIFIPDPPPAEEIIGALRDDAWFAHGRLFGAETYREAEISHSEAFGLDNNIPVWIVGDADDLILNRHAMAECLDAERISFSKDFKYRPHITVSLSEALNPPPRVLLRPLELWYRGQDKIVVLP